MALSIQIANQKTSHVNAYWRVTDVAIDVRRLVDRVILSGYANADARLQGREADDEREFVFRDAEFLALAQSPASGTVYDAIATACYARIVQSPEFMGAIDV